MNNIKSSYLFYDIETTGLNKCFDQVLQFAAIRTDLSFNEIARAFISIRLNPDVTPSPAAIMTHRISMQDMQSGKPEVEGICEIHRLMNTPGTISLGYNNLNFDDEFLRFSFYRNLLPPYTHQYANQCYRMDLFPITTLYHLFDESIIEWPKENGNVSLKLENLNAVNKLATGRAHHAMVDVEATLALAKKFISHRKMWDYVVAYFNKSTDIARTQQLPVAFKSKRGIYREALVVNGVFGNSLSYQAPVLSLGQHQHYKNQSLWLRLDSDTLQSTTENTVAETTSIVRKRAGEQFILLPPLERFLTRLSKDRQQLANENKQWLQSHPEILQTICHYHQHFTYPTIENIDPDAALYELDFSTPEEECLFQQFHLVTPDKKEKIVEQFPNMIRQEQGLRILARHYSHVLSDEANKNFLDYLETSPVDYRGEKRLTPEAALQQIALLKKDNKLLVEEQVDLLNNLQIYLRASP